MRASPFLVWGANNSVPHEVPYLRAVWLLRARLLGATAELVPHKHRPDNLDRTL